MNFDMLKRHVKKNQRIQKLKIFLQQDGKLLQNLSICGDFWLYSFRYTY